MPEPLVLLVVSDLLARSRIEEAAKAENVSVVTARRLSGSPEHPVLVVIDLDQPGALEDVEKWRDSNPAVPVYGFISHVDAEGRRRAEALGVNVGTRGQAAAVAGHLFRDLAG